MHETILGGGKGI